MTPQIAFVAYGSKNHELLTAIRSAVSRANAKPVDVRLETWEFNDIPGQPLTSPILDRIGESIFIVADVTYLNPNVVYEIGFAIGTRKRAFLVRHRDIDGDRVLARETGIFDTLGYFEYRSAEDLCHRLTSHIPPDPLPFDLQLDRVAPVYIVEQPGKGDAATVMTSRLKKARYRYRSFNPTEDPRLSAADAVRQVAASAGVLVSLLADETDDGRVHNTRSMFVAGLAVGMGKPILMLCPRGIDAPLDVRDSIKSYQHLNDISEHIAAFSLEITDHLQQSDPPLLETGTMLQRLRIGDPTAENEITTLGQYYLRTDQFSKARAGEVNLVVGRKGSGKTALFIQLRDRVLSDKRNIVVDLKPEGYQLIKLKEDILNYLSEGTRQHLVTAFWEYLLLLEIAHKLLEKDRNTYTHNHEIHDLYIELQSAYSADAFSIEGDFSERLLVLSQRIGEEYRAKFACETGRKLTTEQVTQLLYRHDIRTLRERIHAYLEHKESVWVLFDNLDKGWSTSGVDATDTIVLRCLIDASRKIERDMGKANHKCHCIVFVRNDVYEHLMVNSADYGKEMRAVLDWDDPDMLREMLRLRLVSELEKDKRATKFEQLWPNVCVSHYKGEETSSYFIDRSLMRPRNFIKILSHVRGFAANFQHSKITEEDIEKGLRAYSNDVLVELDRELTDVFPKSKDLLYNFVDTKREMASEELLQLIATSGVEAADVQRMIDFLLYYGVLGLKEVAGEKYIFDVHYEIKILRVRAQRAGKSLIYVLNPAFWPALNVH